jgi:hypothetical protein
VTARDMHKLKADNARHSPARCDVQAALLAIRKEHAMGDLSNKPEGTLQTLTSDATESARRLAAKQFMKMTRDPLVALLAGHIDQNDPSIKAKIAAFLDTELGGGIIAGILSMGVSMIPLEHPEMKVLASQLRIKAMTDVGDVVADLLMAPLRQVLSDFIRGEPLAALPAASSNVIVPSFVEQLQHVNA